MPNSTPLSSDVLLTYGGVTQKFEKGSVIYYEGDIPIFLYQVIEGEVKLISTSPDGKEFIQDIFCPGDTLGEPALLLGEPYVCTAQASSKSVVIKLSKERFLNLLCDSPDIVTKLLFAFARRIYSKMLSTQMLLETSSEDKIKAFFNQFKTACSAIDRAEVLIPYTRQQIADFTGLRVETVIRTLTRMNKEAKVSIINRKVYY